MAFCGQCGFENPEGAKFCGNCGATLIQLTTENTPVKTAPPTTPIETPPTTPVEAPPTMTV